MITVFSKASFIEKGVGCIYSQSRGRSHRKFFQKHTHNVKCNGSNFLVINLQDSIINYDFGKSTKTSLNSKSS